jgi:hypothetical protein
LIALPGLLQLEAGAHDLDAQVILLVDHHRKRLVAADHHARAALGVAQLAADQVALDEDLLLQIARARPPSD